jgi:hypothetical protein
MSKYDDTTQQHRAAHIMLSLPQPMAVRVLLPKAVFVQ